MKKPAAVFGLCAMLGGSTFSRASVTNQCPGPDNRGNVGFEKDPVIQLAILLDTSNSMDGLIDQARQQLWRIVNELQEARRYGRAAKLHVALYEYGNDRLSPQSGFVRRILPFTSDLDRVSEELFALRTSGGDEYCGTVIQSALDELRWSASAADLKVIVVAGNEPFSQGPVDYRRSCSRARAKGIFVDTIHCGPRAEGEATGWKSGAILARGAFMTIDQDKAVVQIEAPQDGEIARLGIELNKTYLPFGRDGREGQLRQEAQDKNAQKRSLGSSTERAVTKANRLYSNSGWDLVDAVRSGDADLAKLQKQQLPGEMQGLTLEQRRAYVQTRAKERARIQAEIMKLNADRREHVAKALGGKGLPDDTLDAAMLAALRDQAACKEITLR